MKNMEKKKQRRKIRLIKSLVLVVAFVVAISATFGITMAYFGGKSNTAQGTITLKTGIWVNAKDPTTVGGVAYVVPSQPVESECVLTIKSSKLKTDEALKTDQASNALLKAEIAITDGTGGNIATTAAASFFKVYASNGTTHVGNFVKDTDETSKNVYYFLPTGTESYSATALMQPIDTTDGEVTYKFKIKITIPSNLGNAAGGTEVKVSVTYQAIQADFYDTDGKLIDKNITNAKTIFGDSSVAGDATYTNPTT